MNMHSVYLINGQKCIELLTCANYCYVLHIVHIIEIS